MTEPWELFLDTKERGAEAVVSAPNLVIILLTYLRTEMAVRTIHGIGEKLDYPKELISFYIADDGSPNAHMEAIYNALDTYKFKVTGFHNQQFQPRPYCGMGWNQAIRTAHQSSDYIMLLEDDWVLKNTLDIRPFIWALKENEKVGIIRLSNLATDNILKVTAFHGVHYFQYLRTAFMCYSGNPHIRHIRFTQYYGFFDTQRTPGDIEVYYDAKFRQMRDGPEIWRPADLPAWGPFDHIGRERTW